MGALKLLLPAALLPLASPASASSLDRWRPHVEEASRRFGLPAAWIEQVLMAESGGRTHAQGRPLRSRAGAIGLMQVMPATWREIRQRLRLGDDPDAPRDNILAGTFYLRAMYDRFGYPGLFGAYNAGPARYSAYLAGRGSLPLETRNYLRKTAAVRDLPLLQVRYLHPVPHDEQANDAALARAKDHLFFIKPASERLLSDAAPQDCVQSAPTTGCEVAR